MGQDRARPGKPHAQAGGIAHAKVLYEASAPRIAAAGVVSCDISRDINFSLSLSLDHGSFVVLARLMVAIGT